MTLPGSRTDHGRRHADRAPQSSLPSPAPGRLQSAASPRPAPPQQHPRTPHPPTECNSLILHHEDALPLKLSDLSNPHHPKRNDTPPRLQHPNNKNSRLTQHTAHAYRRAPDHIRRLLNQALFDKVYITPDDHTGQLTTTDRTQPPFDTILKDRTEPNDDNTRTLVTHGQTPTTMATDLTTSDTPQTPPAGGHQVASGTRPDLMTPSRTQLNILKQTQNAPKTLKIKQKPAPWIHHDAGLSVDLMVGLAGFEPTTP